MKVEVKFFAIAKQLADAESIAVDLPQNATVKQLRGELVAQFPKMSSIIDHVAFAVDSEYASDNAVLSSDSEVACIPPVSGG